MKSLSLLICFFGSALSNFDRKMHSVLKNTVETIPNINLALFSQLGIIFLCHNMPRTAEVFLEKPKENASKIKFLVFYDGCLKLMKLKAGKRTLSRVVGSELKKIVAYFITLKEFRFAVDYLDTLSETIFNFCEILEPLRDNTGKPNNSKKFKENIEPYLLYYHKWEF